jgi:hypothetical protein
MTKSSTEAARRYNERMYDRVELKLRSGEKKKFKELATENGMTLNEFIKELMYKAADWTEPGIQEIKAVNPNQRLRRQIKGFDCVKIPRDAVPSDMYFVDYYGNVYCYEDDLNFRYAKRGEDVIYYSSDMITDGYAVDHLGRPIMSGAKMKKG